MKPSGIPLRYRLTVRQSVPILAGLMGVLSLLLVMGYLHAREQIVETARLQVLQLVGSIARQDDYNRRWIERGMPPLIRLASTLPDFSPEQREAVDRRIVSIISDERGKQTVEINLQNPDGTRWQHRYDSHGVVPLAPPQNTPGVPAEPDAQSKDPLGFSTPRWHDPLVTPDRTITLRYSAPIAAAGPDRQERVVGVCTVSLDMPWFAERVRSFSSFKNCLVCFMTMNGQWTLEEQADTQLQKLKTLMLRHDSGEYRVTYEGQS